MTCLVKAIMKKKRDKEKLDNQKDSKKLLRNRRKVNSVNLLRSKLKRNSEPKSLDKNNKNPNHHHLMKKPLKKINLKNLKRVLNQIFHIVPSLKKGQFLKEKI